jgi:glyoxylase-like metal-dependent hydrolase (beta-lactamase superfamily II)
MNYQSMKISENVHLLRHDFTISLPDSRSLPRFVNSLVILGRRITLIDTGLKNSWKKIYEYIREQGREPYEIDLIILSHAHPDHIGSAARIKKSSNSRVAAHPLEREWIEDIELQQAGRPVPGFSDLADSPCKVDIHLDDMHSLSLHGEIEVELIHTPGHSPGSLNFGFPGEEILFTADSIPLANDIPNYDNFKDLMRSLERIKADLKYNGLLSSWSEPIFDRNEIEKLISDGEGYLRKIDEVVQKVYRNREYKPLEFCSRVIEELSLPSFYVNPLVDRAFRTHLD